MVFFFFLTFYFPLDLTVECMRRSGDWEIVLFRFPLYLAPTSVPGASV